MQRKSLVIQLVLLMCCVIPVFAVTDLKTEFKNPPDSAKPHTWWHWVHGNITREGITADLEAMQRIGIDGAQIFNVALGDKGPVTYMSPEWHECMKHAIHEADRLGMELAFHNCEGWSSSGGPWITPELAMQMLVWSQIQVKGGQPISQVLSKPHTRLDYYQDVAVVAFPTLPLEELSIKDLLSEVRTGGEVLSSVSELWDGDENTTILLKQNENVGRPDLEFRLKDSLTVRSLTLAFFPLRVRSVELQVSDDGSNYRTHASFSAPYGVGEMSVRPFCTGVFPMQPVSAKYFRVVFANEEHPGEEYRLGELNLCGGVRTGNLASKTGQDLTLQAVGESWNKVEKEAIVDMESIIDLTSKMKPDGTLTWDAPEGSWTVLRFGHTAIGVNNHPSSAEGRGLECDKYSREAAKHFFDQGVLPVFEDAGELLGKTLNQVLIDSYETGPQTWTSRFPEEFEKRRGYRLGYLPALAGWVVGSVSETERFLWDVRRTFGDLWAEHYVQYFAERCHEKGVLLGIEAYGNGNFLELECATRGDIPMSEFWSHSSEDWGPSRQMASVAHIHGKKYVGAEAFTTGAEGWKYDPYSLKKLGDLEFCRGINRFIFHTYAHQPWEDRLPGMALGVHGLHLQRHNVWFEQASAWLKYLIRCQYLLQLGTHVADVCLLWSQGPIEQFTHPAVPEGYSYDFCSTEDLRLAKVEQGCVTFPGGARYRILVLPERSSYTPQVLVQIQRLLQEGAQIVGNPPVRNPSLSGGESSEKQFDALVHSIWRQPQPGKGKVHVGGSLESVLTTLGCTRDFIVDEETSRVLFIHRRVDEHEVYFISNQRDQFEEVTCRFRDSEGTPELWDPNTGETRLVPIYQRTEWEGTKLPIRLDPRGSVFVVFSKGNKSPEPAWALHLREADKMGDENILEITKAVYGILGRSDLLVDVTDQVRRGVVNNQLKVRADNNLAGDPAPLQVKAMMVEYLLDGKAQVAQVVENETLILPDSGAQPIPKAELQLSQEGQFSLMVWEPGVYTLETVSGGMVETRLDKIPSVITLEGPWKVTFDSVWEDPFEVQFPELVSWTMQSDSRIKYYSGTAAYHKEFEFRSEDLSPSRKWVLDLGQLKNLAQVNLNGKDLGVLWKAPFRVDISDTLQTGVNQLELAITNTWTNRLVGDQQVPEDQRKTWIPIPLYQADSPVLESGLLGPVVIRPAEIQAVSLR